MPKVDARKCGALQKVLVGRLVRMGSSQRIAQKMMVSIVYYALEAEFKAYLLNGDTNTTYFTRLAQYLGNYLKGVEALGNDMSKMFVDDVDAGFLDRFPVFSGEIGSRVTKARLDLHMLGLLNEEPSLDMDDCDISYDRWSD